MVKVIGTCGTIGAGKDAAADYLIEKYGYQKVTVGDLVREETAKRGLELSRENTTDVSEEMRKKHGVTYWLERVAEKIEKSGWKKAIVAGVRPPTDDELLRKRFGKDYILVLIDADPKLRYVRMQERARRDAPKSFEDFEKQEKTEWELFKLDVTFKKADHTIKNNGTIEELKENLDSLMKKLGKAWL
jgi:dephospho-CoA kinase